MLVLRALRLDPVAQSPRLSVLDGLFAERKSWSRDCIVCQLSFGRSPCSISMVCMSDEHLLDPSRGWLEQTWIDGFRGVVDLRTKQRVVTRAVVSRTDSIPMYGRFLDWVGIEVMWLFESGWDIDVTTRSKFSLVRFKPFRNTIDG